jgi:hypothetical protein
MHTYKKKQIKAFRITNAKKHTKNLVNKFNSFDTFFIIIIIF